MRLLVIFMTLTITFPASAAVYQSAIAQPVTQGEQTTYPWPMFHHDAGFTGYTESPAPNTANLLWNYTTGVIVCASPAIADDRLFIQSEDNYVYCLNATTGAFVWKYRSDLPMTFTEGKYHPNRASAAVAEGKVYIGSIDDNMYCLNATQ